MQQKRKNLKAALAMFAAAAMLGGAALAALPAYAMAAEQAEGTAEAPVVYADWKFDGASSTGSLGDNTLKVKDASGNGNDLELVVSANGAKASDFLSFESASMTGDAAAGSMKFKGLKEDDLEQLDNLTGEERENYILNDLGYAYLRTVDGAPINSQKFEDGYTIEIVFMMPEDYDASDAWMNILAREGSGANLGSGQWDYEGHHGTMQVNISNCKEIQYMTQNAANSKFNSTLWGLSMDNGGAWYHIAITCDAEGDALRAYTNSGESFRNYTGGGMDGMYASEEQPDGGKFRIGAVISDASYRWCDSSEGNDLLTKLLRGNIQEIRISEGELSQDSWLLDPAEHVGTFGNNNPYGLKNAGNYTFAFLPDTQNTIKFTPEVSEAATRWMTENREDVGLRATVHVGDLVENWDSPEQWQSAQKAFLPLAEAGIPSAYVPGNHDINSNTAEVYRTYFGEDSDYADAVAEGGFDVVFEPADGASRGAGSYMFVEGGSYTYLFVQMMYEPNDDELDWLDAVLSQYSAYPTVITSHNIFSCSDSKPDECDLNEQGERIWSVARRHDNVFMLTAGHNHGSGFIDLENDFGNPVIGMLVDYQFSYNGGNAWYRFMEMDESADKIYFSTFSPYEASREESEKTGYFDLNFMTGIGNERTYDFDFSERFSFQNTVALSLSAPAKTVYRTGETLDLTGLEVTAISPSLARSVSGYTVSAPDMSAPGMKTVTVTYGGRTASFNIYVEEPESAVPPADGGNDGGESAAPEGGLTAGAALGIGIAVSAVLAAAAAAAAVFMARRKG